MTEVILPSKIAKMVREDDLWPPSFKRFRPGREHLEAAARVRTGIEIEFKFNGNFTTGNYRRLANLVLLETNGWEPGTDYSNVEVRSAQPTPLFNQIENLRKFRIWAKTEGTTRMRFPLIMNSNTSFHVHVDAGQTSMECLLASYTFLKPLAAKLVNSPDRPMSRWCTPLAPLPSERTFYLPTDVPRGTKGCEVNRHSRFPTLELRLWDASTDRDLHRLRLEFLSYWIGSAIRMKDSTAGKRFIRDERSREEERRAELLRLQQERLREAQESRRERLRQQESQRWQRWDYNYNTTTNQIYSTTNGDYILVGSA